MSEATWGEILEVIHNLATRGHQSTRYSRGLLQAASCLLPDKDAKFLLAALMIHSRV